MRRSLTALFFTSALLAVSTGCNQPKKDPLALPSAYNPREADLTFNKKNLEVTEGTTFAGDLEFDSLTVMDFVAAIEDEFDIIISMNQQAEIETYGELVDAVCELTEG